MASIGSGWWLLMLIILSVVVSQTFLPAVSKVPHVPKCHLFPADLTCHCELFPSAVLKTLLRVLGAPCDFLFHLNDRLNLKTKRFAWIYIRVSHSSLCFERCAFISKKQGVKVCKQQYLTTLLQLLCLQRLRHKSLEEHFETGCTSGPDEKTHAGSSRVCLHPFHSIFFSLLELS